MIDASRDLAADANVIAVEEVPHDRVHMYGVVGIGAPNGKLFGITEMVEKPSPAKAPSNLIITGRYILQPEIFDLLASQNRGAGGEIQITDAMIALSRTQPFFGLKFEGESYDCGSKIGFLAANMAYALARPDIAPAFREEAKRLLGDS
jgi:UTP--glucose-1-phosphate uridylyltransferase